MESTILMMCTSLILFCPSHSSRVLSGVGLFGRNPTMNTIITLTLTLTLTLNTPRLRRGGDSFFSFKFIFTCRGNTIASIFC